MPKAASLVPMVSAKGYDMDRAETVTILNDLCVLAPAALIDPSIKWEPLDALSARAHFTLGANTVSGDLRFNEDDERVDLFPTIASALRCNSGGRPR